jgi:transcription antitermination protein NusB
VTEPRDLAIQALFEADLMGRAELGDDTGLPTKARRLAEGVLAHRAELDRTIEAASDNWRVDRMPAVDRAILRLALFELRHEPATPTAVVISEAVRIAKEYSTDKSGAFVNGVLAALAGSERP